MNIQFLRLRIAATSIPVYITGWYGQGFESHSQPFLLTSPEADLFSNSEEEIIHENQSS